MDQNDTNNQTNQMYQTNPMNQPNQVNQMNQPNPMYQPNQMYQQNYSQRIPPEYTPISMWGYFGYELLFSIPCVGFILLLVFAFGGTRNINLKNFARSYFCYVIVMVILALLISLMGGVGAALS